MRLGPGDGRRGARPRAVGGLRAPARSAGAARRRGRGGPPHLLPRGPHHGPRGARARGGRLAAAPERLRRRVPALPATAGHARTAAQARRAEDAAAVAPRPAARHPRRPHSRAGPADPPGGAGVQRRERAAARGRGAGGAAAVVRADAGRQDRGQVHRRRPARAGRLAQPASHPLPEPVQWTVGGHPHVAARRRDRRRPGVARRPARRPPRPRRPRRSSPAVRRRSPGSRARLAACNRRAPRPWPRAAPRSRAAAPSSTS